MPFCPVCRDEFEDWVKVCPDDKVKLVPELPSMPAKPKKEDSLVHIATAPNEPIAMMWAGVLDEHDIRCLVKGENLGGVTYIPGFITPFRLMVLESNAAEARRILEPFIQEEQGGERD